MHSWRLIRKGPGAGGLVQDEGDAEPGDRNALERGARELLDQK